MRTKHLVRWVVGTLGTRGAYRAGGERPVLRALGRRVRASRRTAVVVLAAVVVAGGGAAVTTVLTAEPGSQAHAEARGLRRSVPVRIVIPKLDVNAPVVALALDRGELPAPPRATVAGWYQRGTSPGEPGSAVIVGHTGAQRGGPAVFARLDRLVPGDRITVVRVDGTAAPFSVDRLELYSPDAQGYGGGEVSLRLVPAYRVGPNSPPRPVVFATFAP